MRKYLPNHFLYLILICAGVSSLFVSATGFAGLPVQTPNSWPVEVMIEAQRYTTNGQKVLEGIQEEIKAQINGYNTLVSDRIIQGAMGYISSTVEGAYGAATGYVDNKIGQAGDWAAGQASAVGESVSGWFESSDSKEAGEGFSLSATMKSAKEGIAKYGKYAAPAVKLAQGDFLGAASGIKDALYTGSVEKDALSTYSVTQVQGNLKKFVQDATRVTIADATQIMNGTSQYQKVEKAGEKEKPTNVREDIKTQNDTAIFMNVMTNVLLSMDITELSIQSAMIYNNINTISGSSVLPGI